MNDYCKRGRDGRRFLYLIKIIDDLLFGGPLGTEGVKRMRTAGRNAQMSGENGVFLA